MTAVHDLATARTLLFVPGDRPDRFDKAASSGADLVILDLEDAVAPEHKAAARRAAAAWLDGHRACVRVNAVATPWHVEDLAALAGLSAGIVLPMAAAASDATQVHRATGAPVLALVETARGVLAAPAIARADGVVRLGLGALDLAADLGTDDAGVLGRVRTDLVLASRAAGLAGPVDSVTTDLADGDVAGREARGARAVGMGGKLCVHPRQVRPVATAFVPGDEEVAWARRVVEAGAGGGVVVVDGTMVDAPVLHRARLILEEAR